MHVDAWCTLGGFGWSNSIWSSWMARRGQNWVLKRCVKIQTRHRDCVEQFNFRSQAWREDRSCRQDRSRKKYYLFIIKQNCWNYWRINPNWRPRYQKTWLKLPQSKNHCDPARPNNIHWYFEIQLGPRIQSNKRENHWDFESCLTWRPPKQKRKGFRPRSWGERDKPVFRREATNLYLPSHLALEQSSYSGWSHCKHWCCYRAKDLIVDKHVVLTINDDHDCPQTEHNHCEWQSHGSIIRPDPRIRLALNINERPSKWICLSVERN